MRVLLAIALVSGLTIATGALPVMARPAASGMMGQGGMMGRGGMVVQDMPGQGMGGCPMMGDMMGFRRGMKQGMGHGAMHSVPMMEGRLA